MALERVVSKRDCQRKATGSTPDATGTYENFIDDERVAIFGAAAASLADLVLLLLGG